MKNAIRATRARKTKNLPLILTLRIQTHSARQIREPNQFQTLIRRRGGSFSALRCRSPLNVALLRLAPAPSRSIKSLAALDALIFSISIISTELRRQSNKCMIRQESAPIL
jgi:hypothetical protein